MVMKLQLKCSTIVNPQAKLPFPGLPSGNQITSSKLPSSLPTILLVSDLQQSQYPRPRFPALNEVSFYATNVFTLLNGYVKLDIVFVPMIECCSDSIWRWLRVAAISADQEKIGRSHSYCGKLQTR